MAAFVLFFTIALLTKAATLGLGTFFEHFTNWMLLLLDVFFAATTLYVLPACLPFAAGSVCVCLLPLNTIIWSVLVGVVIMLLEDDDDNFLTDIFDEYGAGNAVVGNDALHIGPIIALIFFVLLQQRLVYYALQLYAADARMWLCGYCCDARDIASVRGYIDPKRGMRANSFAYCMRVWHLVAFFVYQTWLGAYVVVFGYLLVADPQEVYSPRISTGAAVALVALVALLFTGIPLALHMACYGLGDGFASEAEEAYARLRTRLTEAELRGYEEQLAEAAEDAAAAASPRGRRYLLQRRIPVKELPAAAAAAAPSGAAGRPALPRSWRWTWIK
jgi:hypothetical protein